MAKNQHSSFDPTDYGLPPNFVHWSGDEAEDAIGPFFFRKDSGAISTAFRVERRHCNAHDTAHGGVLLTFADYTLCLGANDGGRGNVATVSLNCEFAAPAQAGDIVGGTAEVLRRGRSMAFVRCLLRCGDRVVASASAVIKLLPA